MLGRGESDLFLATFGNFRLKKDARVNLWTIFDTTLGLRSYSFKHAYLLVTDTTNSENIS